MDFIQLLTAEHKEVKELFAKCEKQDPIDRDTVELICEKLKLHMEMEEKFLYPVMEEFKKSQEMAEEAELEHAEAKKFLRALSGSGSSELDDVEYKVKFEMLKLGVEHHAEEEEKELFPACEKLLKPAQIQEITEQMVALKEKKTANATK